ncbi:rpoD [Mytilus coruscus]|uniref:RpoD n=1 Tax=Mytilus coruscus TaxID=42192 RepID=A0A6J8CPP4_MYTCO|nr:rpoD [Mytilus coruscus]
MPDYIAVRPSEISQLLDMPEDQTRKILNHPGCSRGQVRLQMGNKKCYKVFKNLLTNNVVKKLEEALKLGQVEEEEDDESDDPLAFDMERPADRPAIDEEIDDDEEQQQQDPQPPQQQQQQQPEPHLPEEPLPEIPKKVQQKRKTLTLLPLVVKKKSITNSQRSSSRSSKGVTSKQTDYYI